MSTTKQSAARTKGLRLAARVATVSGLAVAAQGLAEARAASSPEVTRAAHDDVSPLPTEGSLKAAKGSCGCSPCWGPPAPPAKSRRGTR